MVGRFGVVYSLSPSPLQANTVWAGTDDGLIHVTRDDGKDLVERHAARHDAVEQSFPDRSRTLRHTETAYASVDRHRIGRRQAVHLSNTRRR